VGQHNSIAPFVFPLADHTYIPIESLSLEWTEILVIAKGDYFTRKLLESLRNIVVCTYNIGATIYP
jgi:hypothetical protein